MQLSSWLPASKSTNANAGASSPSTAIQQKIKNSYDAFLKQPPETLLLSALVLGSASTLVVTRLHTRYNRRFPNSLYITPDVFAKKRWIKGVVTSVGDADNFRLYHTPGLGWRLPLKFRFVPSKPKDLTGQTLHIRMAGIDAPEAAHFGMPAQPYAAEALAWLKGKVEGKTVYCQLISRDQYARTVAIPMLPPRFLPAFLTPRFGRCLSLDMLRDGWAVTYEQSGAAYGKWGKEKFLELEAQAKASRRGQWVSGRPSESPAEYKRRMKSTVDAQPDVEKALEIPASETPKRKWFGWLRRK